MNAVLLMLAAHLAVMSSQFGSDIQVSDQLWNSYKLEHDKQYSTMAEEALRRQVFAFNHHKAEKYNRENPDASFKLGTSHLSDMTDEEFSIRKGLRLPEDKKNIRKIGRKEIDMMMANPNSDIPKELDWRKVGGIVSGVKDQGQCASCWAFATTGLLEGQQRARNIITDSTVIPLSEQELLDCDPAIRPCGGGNVFSAIDFIRYIGGIESEEDYPYIAKAGKCKFDEKKVIMTDNKYAQLESEDEELLKRTVATYGPVAVGIQTTSLFNAYKSGVLYDENCDIGLRLTLLIVGYGTTKDGKDYWIVKNSWGTKWGEDGYIRMSRNKDNQCGIASNVVLVEF